MTALAVISPFFVLTGQSLTRRSLPAIGESSCPLAPSVLSFNSRPRPFSRRWFNSDCSQAESFYHLNNKIGRVPVALAAQSLPAAPSRQPPPSQDSPEKNLSKLLLTVVRPAVPPPPVSEEELYRSSSPRPRHVNWTPYPARIPPKPQPKPRGRIAAAESDETPIRADVRAFLEHEAKLRQPRVSSLRSKPTVSSLTFRWRNVA